MDATPSFRRRLTGLDTVQVAYYLHCVIGAPGEIRTPDLMAGLN
jgi:hypothetical protein